jgi:Spy/CpxP family protein refolding chaperone
MSRGQQTFKQSDLTKAIRAAIKAGMTVGRVEIDKSGKIVIVAAMSGVAANGEKPGKNEWDGVLQ